MIKDLWYKNAVVYCLHVGTFMDTNADGTGDFEGLMRRLDYLAGLGVTCLWLMPFQKSPRRDDGYDISDYFQVDPCFGTLGDFVDFTHEAAQRGIRVMIDLVVNHTSDQHPWFQEARRDKKSKFRDYYIWSKKKPKDANEGMVFPGVQKTTWTRDKISGEYYFHRFYDFQPDLNTQNPEVQEEIRKIMGFWLELGVSGFRMDAMPFVIQTKGADKKHIERYDMLRDFREFLQWRKRDAIILAEANIMPDLTMNYFGDAGERAQMMFNFQVNQRVFYALASGDARPLQRSLEATRRRPDTAQWANFLRNHDELDLGRLDDDQRQLVFDKMGPDKNMQLYNRGIRRRLAPMLDGDRRRLELAYSLLFTLPGTPVLRYGDELGMGDNLRLKERNCARTPMQWSTEPHAGFTRSDDPVLPVIEDGAYGYSKINAADQRRDSESLLNWTERMIRMRKEVPEFGWGEFEILETGETCVLGMRYRWRNNSVVALHNFRGEVVEIELRLGDEPGRKLINLLTQDHSFADGRGRHKIVMEPYGYHWYRVGGLGYLLDRTSY
ncbi:MAG TPA: alpha-amylase family protein [Kofleriaceae bacterium]|nr:alpha-amylase family protein [Kofleriaceae bacterium]